MVRDKERAKATHSTLNNKRLSHTDSTLNNDDSLTPTDIMVSRYKMSRQCVPYNPKSLIRTVLGISMIVVGIATWLIPFTTIPLLIGGGVMLGWDVSDYVKYVKYSLRLAYIRYSTKIKRLLR